MRPTVSAPPAATSPIPVALTAAPAATAPITASDDVPTPSVAAWMPIDAAVIAAETARFSVRWRLTTLRHLLWGRSSSLSSSLSEFGMVGALQVGGRVPKHTLFFGRGRKT